jgi:hypothetical protein
MTTPAGEPTAGASTGRPDGLPTPPPSLAPGTTATASSAPSDHSPEVEPACDDRALSVSERIYNWYLAAGQPNETYQGLAFEGYNAYLSLCSDSASGNVDLQRFCDNVAKEAPRYFSDPQAGTQLWLDDCRSGRFTA